MISDGPASDCLVLIGPMGAGKSSVAREMARLGARRWVDTDRLAAEGARMTVAEIFAAHGEAAFRQMETDALRSLQGKRRLVVATGGGIVTRPENLPLLRALGTVVYLTASEDVLFERVSRTSHRPLLQTADPRATLVDLLARRHPLYTACAHLTLDTSALDHRTVARTILSQAQRLCSPRDAAVPDTAPPS